MNIEQMAPDEIETRSFELIEAELKVPLDPKLKPVIKRVIHTTADFDYVDNLCFSDNVVEKALTALREGASIVTDTNMVLAGINKRALGRLGGHAYCYMADQETAEEAKRRGVTRACVSMERAAGMDGRLIFAIGNAPTALISLFELIKGKRVQPELIIGVPVGFVNVVEAKDLIMSAGVPYIVAKGRKGGSNVAAAICNALLYMSDPVR